MSAADSTQSRKARRPPTSHQRSARDRVTLDSARARLRGLDILRRYSQVRSLTKASSRHNHRSELGMADIQYIVFALFLSACSLPGCAPPTAAPALPANQAPVD